MLERLVFSLRSGADNEAIAAIFVLRRARREIAMAIMGSKRTLDAMRTFPALQLGHVADAAFARRCGTLFAASQPMSPDQSFKGRDFAHFETALSLLATPTSETRTFPLFDFGPLLTQHNFAFTAHPLLRYSPFQRSSRSLGERWPEQNRAFDAGSSDLRDADLAVYRPMVAFLRQVQGCPSIA